MLLPKRTTTKKKIRLVPTCDEKIESDAIDSLCKFLNCSRRHFILIYTGMAKEIRAHARDKFLIITSPPYKYSDALVEAITREDREENKLIFEKCVRRSYDIDTFKGADDELKNQQNYAYVLRHIIFDYMVPRDYFWAMEHEKANNRKFTKSENEYLEYMQRIGNFYLKETQEVFDKMYPDEKKDTKSDTKVLEKK